MNCESWQLPWTQQCLAEPCEKSLPELLEQVAGLNAQTPFGPLVGAWARMGSLRARELDELCSSYDVVKINLMRGTVHLVTARQYWAWRPALAPTLKRTVAAFCRGLWDRVDYDDLVAWGTDFVADGRQVTRGDLGESASQRFHGAYARELGFALRMLLPLVEVPPRTVWQPVRTRYVYAPAVMSGTPLDSRDGLQDLARSFARAFASTSIQDLGYWSGLTKTEMAALDAAAPVEPDSRALGRLPTTVLPEFDNLYFCRRSSNAALYQAKKDERLPPARMPGTLIADGAVAAHWTGSKQDGLRLEPWTELSDEATAVWQRFADWYRAGRWGIRPDR